MSNNINIDYIVNKIIAGEKKWLNEELQFQKNYPELIEIELKKRQIHIPIRSKDDSYFIAPYNWTVEKIGKAKKLFGFERCISAPQCVALALFSNLCIDGTICIITDDGEQYELCIIDIGDGVFEVIYTTWEQSGIDNISAICSRVQLNVKIEQIGQIIYVAEDISPSKLYDFERYFGKPILRLSNIADICNRGISILKKIRQGSIKDILLLDELTQTIYVQNPTGDSIRMIEAHTCIPTIQSEMIEVGQADTEHNIIIRQGNNPTVNNNPVIAILNIDELLIGCNEMQKIEVTIRIDVSGITCISAMDKKSGKTIRTKLG